MDYEAEKAWRPEFRDAVREIMDPDVGTTYRTKQDLALDNLADLEPWTPSKYITDIVPNAKDIVVELITPKTDLNALNQTLVREKTAGLTVMGHTHRKARPLIIILTTREKLYAIDPNDIQRGIAFLKLKLRDQRIQFWTTNGIHEADSLYHNYGINLLESRAKCCTGLHVFMMKSLIHGPGPRQMMFPLAAVQRCTKPICLETYENLVEIWLDINKEDIEFNQSQLVHLTTRPLSMTAVNIIRKRCVLILTLARVLEAYSTSDIEIMSKILYKKLSQAKPKHRPHFIKAMSDPNLQLKGLFHHLMGAYPRGIKYGWSKCKCQENGEKS